MDPHPDPLNRDTDPRIRIRIRIRTKMSRIRNTGDYASGGDGAWPARAGPLAPGRRERQVRVAPHHVGLRLIQSEQVCTLCLVQSEQLFTLHRYAHAPPIRAGMHRLVQSEQVCTGYSNRSRYAHCTYRLVSCSIRVGIHSHLLSEQVFTVFFVLIK